MARKRKYRRKSLFKFKLKKQTAYNIFAIVLLAVSSLIILSFFKKGTILDVFEKLLTQHLGWGMIALPFILISISLLFLRLKASFAKPNVSVGLILCYVCLLAITRSGIVGRYIWTSFSQLISEVGALIVFLGMLTIGIVVLFNTSIDEVLKILVESFVFVKNQISPLFKPDFSISKPVDFNTNQKYKSGKKGAADKKKVKEEDIEAKREEKPTTQSLLDTSELDVIANLPQAKQIWEYPPLSLLASSPSKKADRGNVKKNAHIIEKTLESFGIKARVSEVNPGPAVTQYALEIAMGTKLSKITALSNDLALALAAPTGGIRIEAPIPGKSMVGIEVPNKSLEFVTLRQMLLSDELKSSKSKLKVALGLDVTGKPVSADISKMPHVLIAGTTGSGKSVLLNAWISTLLFRTQPENVKLILVDPKRVELTGYNGVPHLLTNIIVEPEKIVSSLKWTLKEMDKRYKLFSEAGARNIESYNEMAGFQAIPYILIFIDELADLMAFAAVEVEDSICRLAQMARATGIHLVISTQRPSTDVITGLIKANIPARIAFNVSSMIDSRVILDKPGAEKLIGRGDMLYIPPDQTKPTRIQGTFVSDKEVKELVSFLRQKTEDVEYTKEITQVPVKLKPAKGGGAQIVEDEKDELFDDAIRVLYRYDRASASLLQRRLSIGYARAARILDQLEAADIVGPAEGSKPRDVNISNAKEYLANIKQSSPVS